MEQRRGQHRGKSFNALLLIISYVGFVSLGFPDAVIGVAWPSVRETFHLQQSNLGWILFGAGLGYAVSSFFSGRVGQSFGIGMVLAASSAFVAASAFGYSVAPIWFLFASCSILHGLGSGAIDAGLNSYVAHHFSARIMNWLHACYCLGAMLGPLVMTGVLTRTGHWRTGYAIIGATMVVLTLLFAATAKLWGRPVAERSGEANSSMGAALGSRAVRLQMLIFFAYTGLEVTCGQWSFTLLTESRGIDRLTAGTWVSFYWGSIGVGRLLLGFVVNRLGIDALLRGSLAVACGGTLLLAFASTRWLMFSGLVLIGLALAPIYPCLMTATPKRLGAGVASHAIGFQTSAAMLGAAALPTLAGYLASFRSLEIIPLCAVVFAATIFALHEMLVRSAPTR